MLRPPALLALVTLIATTPDAGAAEAAGACLGVTLEHLEQRLPAETRRYAVGADLAAPFARLWRQSPPKAASATTAPDAVTVYASGARPFLVAYRTGRCVLAVMAVPRDRLLRVLRQELGQPA